MLETLVILAALVGQSAAKEGARGVELDVRIARVGAAAARDLLRWDDMPPPGDTVELRRDAMLDSIWRAGSFPDTVFFPSRRLTVDAGGPSTAVTRATIDAEWHEFEPTIGLESFEADGRVFSPGVVVEDASIGIEVQPPPPGRARPPLVELTVSIARHSPDEAATAPPAARFDGLETASVRFHVSRADRGTAWAITRGLTFTSIPRAPAEAAAAPRTLYTTLAARAGASEECYLGGPPSRGVTNGFGGEPSGFDETLGSASPLGVGADSSVEVTGPVYLVFVSRAAPTRAADRVPEKRR